VPTIPAILIQRLKTHVQNNPGSAAALLALGFGLKQRQSQFKLNLSFWLDEAMLALNIVKRSFSGLIQPLDYDQGAPLGFLWVIKAMETLLGNREYSLRLFPFLASCLGLILLWMLARQLIQPTGVVFALLIFGSSHYLVSYGVQVKQYTVDVTIALLLQLLALRLLRKECTTRDYMLLAGLGALAVWMSHAAVFILGGAGLVLIGVAAYKKDWGSALKFGLASSFWVLNFAALYFIQYRNLAANAYLTSFWADYFMPLSISAPLWAVDRLSGLFYNPGGMSVLVPALLILLLFGAGAISLAQRQPGWVWMFVLSLILTLAASSLQKYPFGGRMGMFAIPGLLICASEGIELPRKLFKSRPILGWAGTLVLFAYLTFSPLNFAIEAALSPKMTENIAPTMAYLKTNVHEGDVIYLYRMSIPAFRYYAPRYGLENIQVFNGTDAHENRQAYQGEVQQLAGNKRVWFLFSHLADYEYVDDRDAILDYAGQLGEKKREFSQPGTLINLYLYDLMPR